MSEPAEQLNDTALGGNLDEASAVVATSSAPSEPGAGSSMGGVDRWVYFTFIALAVVIAYVVENLGSFAIDYFREVPSWFGGASTVIGLVSAFFLYRNHKAQSTVRGICEELSRVTWPSREETWNSTVVVMVASAIAAVYTGAFDALWSYLTDLIYNINRT